MGKIEDKITFWRPWCRRKGNIYKIHIKSEWEGVNCSDGLWPIR